MDRRAKRMYGPQVSSARFLTGWQRLLLTIPIFRHHLRNSIRPAPRRQEDSVVPVRPLRLPRPIPPIARSAMQSQAGRRCHSPSPASIPLPPPRESYISLAPPLPQLGKNLLPRSQFHLARIDLSDSPLRLGGPPLVDFGLGGIEALEQRIHQWGPQLDGKRNRLVPQFVRLQQEQPF